MARLAAPIVLINVGQQAMGVTDMLMVGDLGGAAIAAVALGNFYFFNISVFGLGLLLAIDPVVSHAIGAGDHDDAARGVQRGVLLSVMIAAIVIIAILPAEQMLVLLRQPTDVVPSTGDYLRMRIFGVLPFFVFNALRQSLQAIGMVRPIVVAVLFANLVNVFANWVLIDGRLGFPALGVAGSGLATAIATTAMAVMGCLARAPLATYLQPWHAAAWHWAPLWRTLRIGLPIGTQYFFESFAFGLTALFMGWMGTASLAGHEIALNMAAMTFMVPLGISGAAAAVVGRAIGRGDMLAARRDALAAIVCGVGFMALTAVVFLAAPHWLATRYTGDVATVAVAASLLPLAGAFQIFDGLQAVTSGVLRGTGDTRIPAILHLVAFWGLGVPLGAYLGFETTLRERGLWVGLVVGLAAAAVLQTSRVIVRLRGHIARVTVETRATHPSTV
jgi:multidrug resistance protein, MATE family